MEQARGSRLRKRMADVQKLQQAEAQIREILREVLTPDAYERFMNVRISNQELYLKVAQLIVSLHMQKQLKGQIGEKELRALLAKLTERHEGSINISRK